MTKPINNKDDLELLIDELGVKAVLAMIATICLEKSQRAQQTKGYYSDPRRGYLQACASIKNLLNRLEV